MQARVTGPAEGDQRRGAVGLFPSQAAVVDDERARGKADAAGAAVAAEDLFPLAAEAGAVTPAAVVAGFAQAAAVEVRRSAGAAQGDLLEGELLFFKSAGHEE